MVNKPKSLALICFLFPAFALSAGKAERFDEDSAKLLARKYVPQRPPETLVWTDELPVDNKVELINDYYTISYPKCFKVEPIIPEEGITAKNSAGLNIERTEKCPKMSGENNNLSITYYTSPSKKSAEIFKTKLPAPVPDMLYAQMISIGKIPAEIEMTVHSLGPQGKFQPFLRWSIYILCEGKKKNETYLFEFASHQGVDAEKFLEQKKFEIPSDYKQIISSFRCHKDL